MRTTLHLVSAADYLAYAGIYRERRIRELQRQLAALGEEADFARRESASPRSPPSARARDPSSSPASERPKLRIEERSPWLAWYGLSAHAGLVNGP